MQTQPFVHWAAMQQLGASQAKKVIHRPSFCVLSFENRSHSRPDPVSASASASYAHLSQGTLPRHQILHYYSVPFYLAHHVDISLNQRAVNCNWPNGAVSKELPLLLPKL